MKIYILSAMVLLSGCQYNQVNVDTQKPYILNRSQEMMTLKYTPENIAPQNEQAIVQKLSIPTDYIRVTKHIVCAPCAEDDHLCHQRIDYLTHFLRQKGLNHVRIKMQQNALQSQSASRIPLITYEAGLNLTSDAYGYTYYRNILQNIDDISGLFDDKSSPTYVGARYTSAMIQKFYKESNVDVTGTNQGDNTNSTSFAQDLQNSILSSIGG